MKENMWAVLVTSAILRCFGEVDANSVHLVPSPIAKVEEGNTLMLHCCYDGSNTPDYINWYLNDDTFGLVIDASSCKYHIIPGQYEIDRYSISCHETKFTLSIANISKGDHQDIWKCDTVVIPMPPPQKASTRIVVIHAGQNGQFDESKTVVVTWIVVGVISAFTVVIAVAGYFLYRKRRNDHLKKINEDHHEVDLGDFHEVHHEDHDEDYDDDHDDDHHEDHDEDYDDDHKQKGTPRADGHACGK